MSVRHFLFTVFVFLRNVALTDLFIAALAGIVCWVMGWTTLARFGTALMWSGLLFIALAGTSFFGSVQLLGDPRFWYAQSVMPNTLFERWRLNMQGLPSSPSVTLFLGTAGILAALIGFWIVQL